MGKDEMFEGDVWNQEMLFEKLFKKLDEIRNRSMTEQEIKLKAREWAFLYFIALPNSLKESLFEKAHKNETEYMLQIFELSKGAMLSEVRKLLLPKKSIYKSTDRGNSSGKV